MKRSIPIVMFICCVLGVGLSQTVTSPSTDKHLGSIPQLLEAAHGDLASVPVEARIDALSDLVVVASNTTNPHANEWLNEVERLAELDNDVCRRARYQARMIRVINTRDPRAALQQLARTDSTCADPLSAVGATVFPSVLKVCPSVCMDDLIATADHLGRLGSYPFTAVLVLSEKLKSGDPAGSRLFLEAISAYKNASVLNWRAHGDFLALLDRDRATAQQPVLVEAVSVAIMRISAERDDAGLQHVTLAQKEGAQLYSDRDEVLSELYRIAEAVDPRLAKDVIDRWPNAAKLKINDAQLTAGVATGGGGSVPKEAQLFLEIEQAKGRAKDSSIKELQNSGVTAPAIVAVLAWRASEIYLKDRTSALAFLGAAADGLEKLDDRAGKVLTAPYVVEAAVKCNDNELASKIAQLQFGIALTLLKELQAGKAVPLTQTPFYWPLKKTVGAFRDTRLGMALIQGIQDDELRARLLIATAESMSNAKH